MPRPSARKVHLKKARAMKRQKVSIQATETTPICSNMEDDLDVWTDDEPDEVLAQLYDNVSNSPSFLFDSIVYWHKDADKNLRGYYTGDSRTSNWRKRTEEKTKADSMRGRRRVSTYFAPLASTNKGEDTNDKDEQDTIETNDEALDDRIIINPQDTSSLRHLL